MTDVKVQVSADASGVDSAIERSQRNIERANEAISRAGGAGGGRQATDAAIREQERLVRAAQQTAERLKRVWREVSGDQARALNAGFENLKRSRSPLAQYLHGLSGPSDLFGDAFHARFASAQQAAAAREQIMQHISRQAGFAPDEPTGRFGGPRLGRWAGAAGGALGSLAMGGGDGGLMSNVGSAAGVGIGALIGGPVGAAVGFFASSLLGKTGGRVDAGMQEATAEAIEVSKLRNALGNATNDFDQLRRVTRAVSEGLGLTDREAARVASEFAKITGASSVAGLSGLHGIGGFARALGLEPGQMAHFFGTLQHAKGVGGDDASQKRFALILGESLARSGTFAKADEVMSAVSNFASLTARQSLAAPDLASYAGLLTTLMSSDRAGLHKDPERAAQIIAAADAGFRGGGGAGEASMNFRLAALQAAYGRDLSGVYLKDIEAQGLFGTLGGAIGHGSMAYQQASPEERARLDALLGQSGSRRNIDVYMEHLKRNYGSGAYGGAMIAHALSRDMFGGDIVSARAFLDSYEKNGGIGSLEQRLAQAGVRLQDIKSMSAVASLSQLQNAGRDALIGQANKLITGEGFKEKLSAEDAAKLDKIISGGNTEELRDAVLKLTAVQGMTSDQGNDLLSKTKDVENSINRMSAALLPATLAVKDAILWAAGKDKGEFEKAQKEAALKPHKDAVDAAYRQWRESRVGVFGKEATDANIKVQNDALAKLHAAERAYQEASKSYDAQQQALSSGSNLSGAEKSAARPMLDAARAEDGRNPKLPRNERNNNPGNIVYGDFAKANGAIGSDGRFAIFPTKEAGSAAMDALLQRYGKQGIDTLSGVIGKWAPPSENDTGSYIASVAKRLGIGANQRIDLSDPELRARIAREIARHEGSESAYVPSLARRATEPLPEEGRRAQAESPQKVALSLDVSGSITQPNGPPILPQVNTRVVAGNVALV